MPRPSINYLSFMKAWWEDPYSEEEFFRSGWNFVDVPDDKGILRHGMVVGKTRSGLVVDFAEGQSPRLVKYGRSFHVRNLIEMHIRNADKIQVLLRITNTLPFTWFDGKLVDPDPSVYPPRLVAVELEMDGVVKRELVHTSQIRDAPAAARERFISNDPLIVKKNYFGTGSYQLADSDARSFSESSSLWKIFSQELSDQSEVLPMCVRKGNLQYMWRRSSEDDEEERVLGSVEHYLHNAPKHSENCLKKGLVWSGRFHTMAPVPTQPDDQSACGQLLSLSSLPINLLVDIFQFLDSADRVGQRRVCAQWNDILGTGSIFNDVLVTLKYPYDCPVNWSVWDGLHAVVMAMTTLVTKYTKWVIIVESADSRPSFYQQTEALLRLLVEIARHFTLPSAGKLNLIISQYKWFAGCSIYFLQTGLERLAAICTKLAYTYDKLMWKNCIFDKRYSKNCEFWEDVIFVREGSIKPTSPNVLAELWEMLNSSVPETDPKEISQWLASVASERGDIANVQEILDEFQTADPRLTGQAALYRSDELARVDCRQLKVGRLTRLTQWAIAELKAKDDADFEDELEDG